MLTNIKSSANHNLFAKLTSKITITNIIIMKKTEIVQELPNDRDTKGADAGRKNGVDRLAGHCRPATSLPL